jgi:hypothetical protein
LAPTMSRMLHVASTMIVVTVVYNRRATLRVYLVKQDMSVMGHVKLGVRIVRTGRCWDDSATSNVLELLQ